jgi:hypothetical protein
MARGRQRCSIFLCCLGIEDRLGCRSFDFDFQQDVVVNVRNGNTDGGIHRRAHELLRRFLHSHQNAVVMLDKNFGGRLPAAVVRGEIRHNLLHNGWSAECVEVVVIDPELEVWLWQRGNLHVTRAFRYNGPVSLEAFLEAAGFWSTTASKPARPKKPHVYSSDSTTPESQWWSTPVL